MIRREWYLRAGVIAFFVVAAFLGRWFGLQHYMTIDRMKLYAQTLEQFTHTNYVQAVGLYHLIFVASMILILPIAIVLCIVGGFMFGAVMGTLYATLSASLASLIFFFVARHLFADCLHQRCKVQYERFDKEFEKNGARYIIMMHLLPATPVVLMAICAGLSEIAMGTFFWATFVGLVPGTLAYALIGSHVHAIGLHADISSAMLLATRLIGSLAIIALLLWYRRSR